MLKIVDLNRNEELSASRMGKVAGGMSCEDAKGVADDVEAFTSFWWAAGGLSDTEYLQGMSEASGLRLGGCAP
jgi:hypothetical protein